MRNFLIALVLLLWGLLAWLYSKDYLLCCTPSVDIGGVSTLQVKQDDITKTGPLLFNWSSAIPLTGEDWPSMRDSLLSLTDNTHLLEIISYYCTNGNPAETDSIALSRGQAVQALFTSLSAEQVTIVTKGRSCDSAYVSTAFPSMDFNIRVNNESIKEIDDETLIYFPFNSTQKLKSSEIESYLDDVAKRVVSSNEKVQLTGHTDNIGDSESNTILGKKRAQIIANYLISKGVNVNNIIVNSAGESQPVSDNNTENGRALNRRTVLKIIK